MSRVMKNITTFESLNHWHQRRLVSELIDRKALSRNASRAAEVKLLRQANKENDDRIYELRKSMDKLKEENKDKNQEIKRLNAQIASMERDSKETLKKNLSEMRKVRMKNVKLKQGERERKCEIDQKLEELRVRKDEKIDALHGNISALQGTVRGLEATLKGMEKKDERIKKLVAIVNEQRDEIVNLLNSSARLKKDLNKSKQNGSMRNDEQPAVLHLHCESRDSCAAPSTSWSMTSEVHCTDDELEQLRAENASLKFAKDLEKEKLLQVTAEHLAAKDEELDRMRRENNKFTTFVKARCPESWYKKMTERVHEDDDWSESSVSFHREA